MNRQKSQENPDFPPDGAGPVLPAALADVCCGNG